MGGIKMKMEFRTKTNVNGHCYYLRIDTNDKTVSTVPEHWVSKDVPTLAKRDLDTLKAQAITDGYTEV
jgi:hypothetical protein